MVVLMAEMEHFLNSQMVQDREEPREHGVILWVLYMQAAELAAITTITIEIMRGTA